MSTSTKALGITLALGFALRLARPEVHSFWIDEGATLQLAQSADLLHALRADSHPPLSFLIVRVWGELFGWSDLALRLLPALVSCVSLVLFVPLARAWLGREQAIWAVLLLAAAPLAVWIAHEVRMYALVELSVLLVMHAARRAWLAPALARWALLAFAVALASGLHYYGVLAALIVIAQALVRRQQGALSTRAVGFTIVACALGFALWLPLFATLLPHQLVSDWPRITHFEWRDLAELPARLVAVDLIVLVEHGVSWIGWVLGALCSAGIAISALHTVARRSEANLEMLAAALVPLLAALVLANVAGGGFQPRYLVVAMPGTLACIAAGWLRLRPPQLGRVALAGLIACALATSLLQLSENRREDYRAVCREIAERWRTGDRLLVVCCVPRPFRLATVDHYLRDRPEILASVLDQDDYLAGVARPPSGTRLHVLWREATLCREPFEALQRTHVFDESVPARFRIHRLSTHVP